MSRTCTHPPSPRNPFTSTRFQPSKKGLPLSSLQRSWSSVSVFKPRVDQTALAFFVLCGVLRLARFNVAVSLQPKNAFDRAEHMEGLPTACAAINPVVALGAAMASKRLRLTFDGILWMPAMTAAIFSGCWWRLRDQLQG